MSQEAPHGRALRAGTLALCAAAIVLAASRARADADPAEDPPLEWKWRKAPALEYVVAGVLAGTAFAAFEWVEPQTTPHWSSGILFDNAARDVLRLRSPSARDTARSLSNITGITTLAIALAVDSVALPLIRGNFSTLFEVLLIDVEAISLNSLATSLTFDEVGRARPSRADCLRDPNFDPLCHSGITTSFFSGHTSQAFAAAGVSCAHHLYLKLYGNALDAASCAGSLTLASATGLFRILGDRHWATDVVTASLVGFGFGYGLPVLLHYSIPAGGRTLAIAPAPGGAGFSLSGTW